MFKHESFHSTIRLPPLCMVLTAALLFIMGAPPGARAQVVCDDGWCNNVNRAHYEFGEQITESCHFIGNVSRPAGKNANGFTVAGHGITIDGMGYCLDGVSPSLAITGTNGIFAQKSSGAYDVTIKNLEIKNFWQGIKLRGNGTADPITGCVVDNCIIHDNGVEGDDNKYEGIWLDVAQDCTVTNCTIYNNKQGSGIACGEGDYNTFTYNEIYGNMKHAIKTWWDSWYITSRYNNVYDNGWGGVDHRSGANYGILEYNTARNNTGPGIQAGGTGNIVRGNVSTNNVDGTDIDPETGLPYDRGYGIDASGDVGSENELYDNVACGNQRYDIYLGDNTTGTGDNNTCNTTYKYADVGSAGCDNQCEEGLPVARFYAFPTLGCGTVHFYDQSDFAEGSTLTWEWDFGDGQTSTAQNPVHAYGESGVYTVTLTVTMSGGQSGTDSVTRENYVTVCPYLGDIDEDSDVDGADYYSFYANCIIGGQPSWCDIDGDGFINSNDMANLGLMDCVSCP